MENRTNNNEETTLRNFFLSIKEWLRYFRSKWWLLAAALIIGGIAGFFYASRKPVLYEALNTFVLDDDKSSGSPMMDFSAIGIDLGGQSQGLFSSTKNIIWLYQTRLMIGTTLLTPVTVDDKQVLLYDLFLKENNLQKSFGSVSFKIGDSLSGLSKEQNAVIQTCIGIVSSPKYLNVQENKQANGVISVGFKSKDEQFSKLFSDVLIKTVNQYYIETRTQKIAENVKVLEQKMDSTKRLLTNQTIQVAASVDNVPYANPNKTVLRASPERQRVDIEATKGMYLELAKSLESRRMTLSQETPLIKIIDASAYPLNVIKTSKILYAILFGIVFEVVIIISLYLVRLYTKIMKTI